MTDLFDQQLEKEMQINAPLADRVRPQSLDDFFSQFYIFLIGL